MWESTRNCGDLDLSVSRNKLFFQGKKKKKDFVDTSASSPAHTTDCGGAPMWQAGGSARASAYGRPAHVQSRRVPALAGAATAHVPQGAQGIGAPSRSRAGFGLLVR